MPHDFQFDDDTHFIKHVYKSYIDSFDYHIWYPLISHLSHVPQGVNMIHITPELKEELIKLYNHDTANDNIILDFKQKITNFLYNQNFIRLSSTSGKNVKSVKPLTHVDEIIQHLTTNKLFVEQEYQRNKSSYLIIMPWNDAIDDRYEYRLFVVNGKLTGASQQNVRQLYNYTFDELDMIEHALTHISFLSLIPYQDYVADVYIKEGVCHLIELNPFGASSGAGSSLFHWVNDYDILYGLKPPQWRYLSILCY